MDTVEQEETVVEVEEIENKLTRKVHVFYYPWYGNPDVDPDGWNHWDHTILPHWNAQTREQYPHGKKYKPPEDIGAVFYPLRGPYSSADKRIVQEHFQELKDYVIAVSWWGRGKTDGEGKSTDSLMPLLFKVAEKVGAKLCIHLEPYEGEIYCNTKLM